MRGHASEREKLTISANYYDIATGEPNKAPQTYQEWIASYPREPRAHLDLGNVYIAEGRAEKAAEEYREALRLAPDHGASYGNLVNALLALQRFDEARQTIQQAQAQKLDRLTLRSALYALAFLSGRLSSYGRTATVVRKVCL